MVADLTDSTAVGAPLDGLMFGGAPAPDLLAKKARQAFPTASVYVFTQLYLHGLIFTPSKEPRLWTHRNEQCRCRFWYLPALWWSVIAEL